MVPYGCLGADPRIQWLNDVRTTTFCSGVEGVISLSPMYWTADMHPSHWGVGPCPSLSLSSTTSIVLFTSVFILPSSEPFLLALHPSLLASFYTLSPLWGLRLLGFFSWAALRSNYFLLLLASSCKI